MSRKAALGVQPVNFRTCSSAPSRVVTIVGIAMGPRPTIQLSSEVLTMPALQPNSYFLCTLPLAMHFTSGACTL